LTQSAKVMLLGDIGVGKSSLARRLVFDRFDSEYKTTIGVDVLTYDIALGPNSPVDRLRLILWDTDGDFGLAIFETVYVRGASAAIIVADASRPATMVKMANLARSFSERMPGRPVCNVINKIDLASGRHESGSGHPEVGDVLYSSALTGEGVGELFTTLGEAIVRRGL
jgi:Ras-related protein Rab-5C